ncbi:MAG: hypothetical protein HC869_17090 [Rhodospirillales bacterium]|nr:hypothetical protein [Rhodospirillales bacterium]
MNSVRTTPGASRDMEMPVPLEFLAKLAALTPRPDIDSDPGLFAVAHGRAAMP